MAAAPSPPEFLLARTSTHVMNLATSKLLLRSFPPNFRRCFCTPIIPSLESNDKSTVRPNGARVRVSPSELVELKENWLDSLSCPFPFQPPPQIQGLDGIQQGEEGTGGKWVVGIDPDVSGALALLRDDHTAQVFDAPHLQVLVGKRVRKRLDARSIVQLLHSFNAPLGTTAYIEQSRPFPQDGKQGWYSGGFTYGLWLGILVSSGFSVVPISSRVWKDQFQLSRNFSSKDDSRKAASDLFPSLGSLLKRKKDHGRAEALLIAAYGKGLRLQCESSAASTETSTPAMPLENSSRQEQ